MRVYITDRFKVCGVRTTPQTGTLAGNVGVWGLGGWKEEKQLCGTKPKGYCSAGRGWRYEGIWDIPSGLWERPAQDRAMLPGRCLSFPLPQSLFTLWRCYLVDLSFSLTAWPSFSLHQDLTLRGLRLLKRYRMWPPPNCQEEDGSPW